MRKFFISLLPVTVLCLGLAIPAMARTIAAGNGRTASTSDSSCMALWNGRVQNTCNRTVYHEVELATDNDSSRNVTFMISGSGVHPYSTMSCTYVTYDFYAQSYQGWTTSWTSNSSSCPVSNGTTGSVAQPSSASAYVSCAMPLGWQFISARYTP